MNHKRNIIILTIFFILLSIMLWGKTGNIFIDFSREVYIPYAMQNSKLLIKDVFLIYGAFGYIVNFLISKISTNINLLLFEAHIISYIIFILFYFILNVFFSKKVSLIFSIFFAILSIFSDSTFSFVMPYSYSTLWAIMAIFATLYSLLYNKKKGVFLFLGLILVNKVEYFIPSFLASIFYLTSKKENFLKEFFYIFIFPSIPLFYLLILNITQEDIIKNYSYIKTMLSTNALTTLYKGMGVFFEINYFKYSSHNALYLFTLGVISYLFYYFRKETISYILLIIGLIFINCQFTLNLIAIPALLITLINLKQETISKDEILLFIFSIILCSKAIFAINFLNYSNFGYCLILYYTYLQMQKIMDRKWLINSMTLFFIFCTIDKLTYAFNNPKIATNTNIGKIWVEKNKTNLFKKTNQFIEKHINENEKFVVIPEGLIFNLIHKKPYNFYNTTFTPLDFQTFGDVNIIRQLAKDRTDYVIFFPRNTKEYGAQTICYDYGVDFCEYIIDNYTRVATLEDGNSVLIFKKKNEK